MSLVFAAESQNELNQKPPELVGPITRDWVTTVGEAFITTTTKTFGFSKGNDAGKEESEKADSEIAEYWRKVEKTWLLRGEFPKTVEKDEILSPIQARVQDMTWRMLAVVGESHNGDTRLSNNYFVDVRDETKENGLRTTFIVRVTQKEDDKGIFQQIEMRSTKRNNSVKVFVRLDANGELDIQVPNLKEIYRNGPNTTLEDLLDCGNEPDILTFHANGIRLWFVSSLDDVCLVKDLPQHVTTRTEKEAASKEIVDFYRMLSAEKVNALKQ